MMANVKGLQTSLTNLKLWGVFFLYVIVAGYAIAHHELWGDELHSWNIAKASSSFADLMANTRYEGHPPVWYIMLWSISKFSTNLVYVQFLQLVIACAVVFMVLFYTPFTTITKILIPFGYYFLFEYGILSRNYAIGILPALCICFIMQKEFRYKLFLYYGLLFLMSNTHLLALILAGSLHLYFLFLQFEQKKKTSWLFVHALLGLLVLLPAFYFIFPPSDSGLNTDILISKFDRQHLGIIAKIPLRTFVPVPAWWEHNFWNTQFLLQLQHKYNMLRPVTLLLSIGLLTVIYLVLRGRKKSLALFFVNLFLTFIVAIIFPLTTQRYIGFIYIAFIAACWLRCYEIPATVRNSRLINILLTIQLAAGVFTVAKDIQLPFSNSSLINELINAVPANEKIVTDYWCVNTISAYNDKRFYCVGIDREASFLLWNKEFDHKAPGIYVNSIKKLVEKEGLKKIYLVSTYSPQIIFQLDTQLQHSFTIELVDKRKGAIEKWSNLYLYRIIPHAGNTP